MRGSLATTSGSASHCEAPPAVSSRDRDGGRELGAAPGRRLPQSRVPREALRVGLEACCSRLVPAVPA